MDAAGEIARVAHAAAQVDERLPQARQAARASRFHGTREESLLGRLIRAFVHWLADLLPPLHLPGGRALGLGVEVLAAALALVAVFLLARRLRRPKLPVRARAAQAPPFDDERRRALALAGRDAREALRVLYAATLAELARRRGWPHLPGRSNWGFVRRLGAATPQGGALAECTRLVEARVYGDRAALATDVELADRLALEALA